MTATVWKFEPAIGTDIEDACSKAVDLARKHDCKVEFTFNDIDLVAYTTDNGSDVSGRWRAERERRRLKYLASPEYAKHKQERECELAAKQDAVNQLVSRAEFDMTEEQWMEWVARLTEVADDVGVKTDCKKLGQTLRGHGWVINKHVTDDQRMKNLLAVNKTMMAEYIMGQVIGFLDSGMSPHPVAISFVDKYRAI